MHDLSVIVTLSGALGVALVLGAVTQRLGLSTLVGYMLAGLVVGPFTPGFVADTHLAQQMAEIGVILLMFGVGLHFHPQELLRVKGVAVPGAVVQSAVAGAAGWALARAVGWTNAAGIVFGMALAVASTVVLVRMLVQEDRLASHDGHVAVGWLVVEDLFTVIALVMLPVLGGKESTAPETAIALAAALGKALVFAALVWIAGRRFLSPVMERVARTRSRELMTLSVFVAALGIAALAAEVFHMSVALGAFFAGLVVGQSRVGPQASADMSPFSHVFSALFFVSIGMLLDPAIVLRQPLLLAGAVAIVLIAKPLAALAIVLLLRDGVRTAATVAVGLAQIGEFSFILAGLGGSLGVLPPEGNGVIVAAAIVSIAINPVLFRLVRRVGTRASSEPAQTTVETVAAAPIIVVGLGDLGRRFIERAAAVGYPVCAIDDRIERVDAMLAEGRSAVFGAATQDEVLRSAHAADARVVVVTRGSLAEKMQVVAAMRRLNARVALVATAESQAERAWLEEAGAAGVADVQEELATALMRAVRRAL